MNINLHSSSLIYQVSNPFLHKYQSSSGQTSSLLMKTSHLRLKLVGLNFFASFMTENQSNFNISSPILSKSFLSMTVSSKLGEYHFFESLSVSNRLFWSVIPYTMAGTGGTAYTSLLLHLLLIGTSNVQFFSGILYKNSSGSRGNLYFFHSLPQNSFYYLRGLPRL